MRNTKRSCRIDLSFVHESPPEHFSVDTQYIPPPKGQLLNKFDVYLATIGALAELAVEPWNRTKPHDRFLAQPEVGIGVTGSDFQVKSVIWTLYIVNTFMEDKRQFAELNFKTFDGDRLLGVGKYFKGSGGDNDVLSLTISNHTNTGLTVVPPNPKPPISFTIEWIESGRTFQAHQIFFAIMKLIIDVAELEVDDPNPGILFYTPRWDFTIAIRATSKASVENLRNYIIVFSLQALAGGMARERIGGRWQELKGLIRWFGKIVGILLIKTGRVAAETIEEEISSS